MTSIILDLAVGSRLDVADAHQIAAAAVDAGVSAIRILDGAADEVLDPTAVAAYLAVRVPELRWIVEAPTTHNAPYNLARRVLSLDHATAGRAGLALRAGDGDEVSDAAGWYDATSDTSTFDTPTPDTATLTTTTLTPTTLTTTTLTPTTLTTTIPDREATGRRSRWAEYAHVLTDLWQSFPTAALLGDQAAGVFADTDLISPIAHEGGFYRIAGPLDGPSSVQGRPVLLADARDELAWEDVAALADVLVVSREQAPIASWRLAAALEQVGRRREEVAVLGRADMTGSAFAPWTARELADWAASHALDGLELVIDGDREEILTLLRALGPWPHPAPAATLRQALGLPELAGASA
jgi:alkanesulfonate monooxygenase SsuD/methylene tetrahydromethanopterin reductase-like flavin-dependent oxidoreductase (luciferase family)